MISAAVPTVTMERDQERRPPAWIFAILAISGAVTPYACIAMPFMLRKEGVPVETIASISALTLLPWTFYVVLSPLADILVSRKTWFWTLNLAAAALLYAALQVPRPHHLALFTALLVAGNTFVAVSFAALNRLMAVLVPTPLHGRTGGWFQAGNLGSVQLVGGIGLWLLQVASVQMAAAAFALMSFLPTVALFWIHEPARQLVPNRALVGKFLHELGALFRLQSTWVGFLFFLSPFGAGAAINLFSAVGQDFHANPAMVAFVAGLGGVIPLAAGAVAAGYLCDRFDRRRLCVASGLLGALAAATMIVAPRVPATFALGAAAYMSLNGFTWATFCALSLELSGNEAASAGTRMTLFAAAMQASAMYMTWLDGKGYAAGGIAGLLKVDAGASVLAGIGLLFLLWRIEASARSRQRPS